MTEGLTRGLIEVDQGALRLAADASDRLARAPRALLETLLIAAERDLYVGPETVSALCTAATHLPELRPDLCSASLRELVLCDQPAKAIDLAVRTGLAARILPDLDRLRAMPRPRGLFKDVYIHTLRVVDATPVDAITRLAALLHDIAKPDTLVIEGGRAHFPNHDLIGADRAARRLRGLAFEEEIVTAVETLVRLHLRANSYEPNWTDSAVRRLHLDAGEHWQRLLNLSYADVTSARSDAVARARRRVTALADHAASLDRPVEVSPLDGNELMAALGRGPGKWIGRIKQHLIERVREGTLDATDRDAAWHAVRAWLAENPDEPSAP